jgi:mannose-6-phosphate isomerase-like protein (cupin superfamily)
MKGTHLARVARAQHAGFRVPLEGVLTETLWMTTPSTENITSQTIFLVLEGEVVVDLPDDFVHLRRGEAVTLEPQTVKFSPVEMCVLLRITKG